MISHLLDTNLCVRVLRDRNPEVKHRFKALEGALSISTIVLVELRHGAARSTRSLQNHAAVQALTDRITVLPFSDAAAEHAADIRATLEDRGEPIGDYDVLIAGHARSLGLILVTGNLREFRRVDGLRCEDWLANA